MNKHDSPLLFAQFNFPVAPQLAAPQHSMLCKRIVLLSHIYLYDTAVNCPSNNRRKVFFKHCLCGLTCFWNQHSWETTVVSSLLALSSMPNSIMILMLIFTDVCESVRTCHQGYRGGHLMSLWRKKLMLKCKKAFFSPFIFYFYYFLCS